MKISEFSRYEIELAKEILWHLKQKPKLWPVPKIYESIFFIDTDLNFVDLSINRRANRVGVKMKEYELIMDEPHILAHNHPSGKLMPSFTDWGFMKGISEKVGNSCMGGLIVQPGFRAGSLFHYGKGRINIFSP